MDGLNKGILIGSIIGFAAGVAIVWLYAAFRSRSKARKLAANKFGERIAIDELIGAKSDSSDAQEIAQLRQNLRVKFLHNESQINAAIQFERKRNPGGSEVEWLKAAIYRWERDNR